jgi:shikimate kinase
MTASPLSQRARGRAAALANPVSLPPQSPCRRRRRRVTYSTMIVTLIGYRATGKTTLARLLAERLGWDWIDADVEIERLAEKSIERIFAEDGEPKFRDLEARVIGVLCRRDQLILAAGGGAPLRAESRQAMRSGGKVVWLMARPETILVRMSADATTPIRRPSLTGRDPLAEICELLAAREPIYREAADMAVDTEGKTPQELVDQIVSALQNAKGKM